MAADRIYRAVVVEDEPMIVRNVVQKIEKAGSGIAVAGSAQDGSEAISVVDALKPDVLITDIRMPRTNGLELIRQVKDKYPDIQVVIISGYGNFEYAQQAIKLGVKDYLLKPISVDALRSTLDDIRLRLDAMTLERERDFLLSCLAGSPDENTQPETLIGCRFGIFLICIGHLLNHAPGMAQSEAFARLWTRACWGNMLPPEARWQTADGIYTNQKYLVVAADGADADARAISSRLKEALESLAGPLPVNIGACPRFGPCEEIRPMRESLEALLGQRLAVGRSAIITPDPVEWRGMPPAMLDAGFQNRIEALIGQGNQSLLKAAVFAQMDRWRAIQPMQKWLETVLHLMLKLFQRQLPTVSEEEVILAEYDLNEKLATSPDLPGIYEDVWAHIEGMLALPGGRTGSVKELAGKVGEYIREHFCDGINIEQIARKFSFNPTYLTKIFKKEWGVTPVRYIIALRIQEAERLLRENLGMDIKRVGEIVGYDDPQYFSRVFKDITGCTPTEYRNLKLS